LTSQNPHVDKKADVNIKDDDGVSEWDYCISIAA